MRYEYLSTILLIVALLFSCGGGSSSSSSSSSGTSPVSPPVSPPIYSPSLPAAELTFSPRQESAVIGIENPMDFANYSLDSLTIVATRFDQANYLTSEDATDVGLRVLEVITLTEILAGVDEYIIGGLTDETRYTFELLAFYQNDSVVDMDIDFVWRDNRQEHRIAGGIMIGANHDGDAMANSVDGDDDNDAMHDSIDDCALGEMDWQSNHLTDYDGDGCRDAGLEDPDDDNDGMLDTSDDCARGEMSWQSSILTDHDGDGCRDEGLEDPDDDNDGMMDEADTCSRGETMWRSNGLTDHDGDGCRDEGLEDPDDDNDGMLDTSDDCARGELDWQSGILTDHDGDGCRDEGLEDPDDDNDGMLDEVDTCSLGETMWRSNGSTDYDGDGCRDEGLEDPDDDNDGMLDTSDDCARGELDWQSNHLTDYDGDGCRDEGLEDPDDDNDGMMDEVDVCSRGETMWRSNGSTDHDGDGCRDNSLEDLDDDNDGMMDEEDQCSHGDLDWPSNNETDYDGDGCSDNSLEDLDDDNDGVHDSIDDCERGQMGWRSNVSTDNDGDGCRDASSEDLDDDNDQLLDHQDTGSFRGIECRLLPDCDGDLVLDRDDLFPLDESESNDTDGDMVGDNRDGASYVDGISCAERVDCDDDGAPDSLDIDDDGDGLIEIGSSAELDEVRYQLDGSGVRRGTNDNLDTTGCGSELSATCLGYELVANISLSDHIDSYYGTAGWQPLGQDNNTDQLGCQGEPFSAIFDGNGREIEGLRISRPEQECVGLFGAISHSTIRNLHLSVSEISGRGLTGALAGYMRSNALVIASSAVSNSVATTHGIVGGLIGQSASLTNKIISSYTIADSIRGSSSGRSGAGGLVGLLSSGSIVSSYAIMGDIYATYSIGGLTYNSQSGSISHSFAVFDDNNRVGGIVGISANSIVSSYWDSSLSGVSGSQTTSALQMPTAYEAIYSDWRDDIDGDNRTVYCDSDGSGSIEGDEQTDDNLLWDFGTTSDYPALSCSPLAPAAQRALYEINEEGELIIRLD